MNSLECLFLMIWPIISMVLGLVAGLVTGTILTLVVFVFTLVRTPLHIAKTMRVTATTRRVFQPCRYFDPLLRVLVFCLVPIPHLLWLGGITACTAACGYVVLIGAATRVFFQHDYAEACEVMGDCLTFEKHSLLGEYLDLCQDFVAKDGKALEIVCRLKALGSLVPGILLGALPFIPFSVMITLITIYRLPINVYKTMKIAFNTVLLQWDLKLLTLITLPLVHTFFPLVVFVVSLVGSLLFFIAVTSKSIYEGDSPFAQWGHFQSGLKEYHEAHQEFVGEHCDAFDHPSGIPLGWRGDSYGLPIQKILKWQRDFVVCCFLLLLGFPICLIGNCVTFAVLLVPGILTWWGHIFEFISENSMAEILGCWAVFVLCFVLAPAAAVVTSLVCITIGTFMSFRIPNDYLKHGYKAGLYAPFAIIREVDDWEVFGLEDFKVFACLPKTNPYIPPPADSTGTNNGSREAIEKASKLYWDRFARQCVQTTANLLESQWITMENVKNMEPSLLQAIPAVAILTILVDTLNEGDALEPEDIMWKVDGTMCKKKDRPPLDNVAQLLWPKVMQAKRQLDNSKQNLASPENVRILTALLCANTDETTDELKAFVKAEKADINTHPQYVANGRVRAPLVDLSLAILRVKPFQDRMTQIFDHAYGETP